MTGSSVGSPDFVEILADCTAELGQTVKLACKVTGTPKPSVAWYKGESRRSACHHGHSIGRHVLSRFL